MTDQLKDIVVNETWNIPNKEIDIDKGKSIKEIKSSVIVGGTYDDARRYAAQRGDKPRVDVLEMESMFDSILYDFSWLDQHASKETFTARMLQIGKLTGDWSTWLSLRAFREMQNHKVIYAAGEDVGIPLAILLRIFRKKYPKIILRLEQPTYGHTPFRSFVYRSILHFALKQVSQVLCRTNAHVKYIDNIIKVDSGKVLFYPETTDSVFFNPSQPVDKDAVAIVPPKPFIVSAGLEMRDYTTLVDSVRSIPVQVVIGAGSPWSKFHYQPSGDFLPANVKAQSFTPRQMRELYRSADIVVLPIKPTMRACGMNVILEAWSMKRPVIVSKTEGLTSYIEDGRTGIFVEPGNAKDLQDKIIYLLENPDLASQLGENGFRKVATELNLDCYLETVQRMILFAANEEPVAGK